MDNWVLGLILVVGQTIITTAIGFIVTKILTKKAQEKEELEKLREEKRASAENQRCQLVKETIHEEIEQLEDKLTKNSTQRHTELKEEIRTLGEDLGLVKKGLQNDLYIDLVHLHDDYVNRGYATRDDKRDYDNLYINYHNLGQNGIADGMHAKVMGLPEAPKGE